MPDEAERLRKTAHALRGVLPRVARSTTAKPPTLSRDSISGNGARLERLNWLADTSKRGLQQSAGMMVNYLYRLDEVEHNHEMYVRERKVAASRELRRLAAECPLAQHRQPP